MIAEHYAIDYQVHSFRSHDGLATIHDQCVRAIEIGLDEIGFTEHKDFDPKDPVVNHFDYVLYSGEIDAAREEFAGRLVIRKGIEIDYQKWFVDEIREYLGRYAFDYVLGSVHYADRQMLMTAEYLMGRSREEAYNLYFEAVLDSVKSGLIDIVGHLEYANRRGVPALGPYSPEPFEEKLNEIFVAMIERGVVLEINTAGLRQGVGLTYPSPDTVVLYSQCGGKRISIGSDAHGPRDLGYEYAQAVEIALGCGLTDLVTWRERVATSVPLAHL